tara:strand:- start:177 stop:569 length:393 start_codon:yes stop_codon:yes gene_type:complete
MKGMRMGSFFELRIYKVNPGKMEEWVELMEKVILPFQTSKGMVVHGSFIEKSFDQFSLNDGNREMNRDENRNNYIWIRRFQNEAHKEKLYKDVYESEEWVNDIGPKVANLIDRNSIKIHNLTSTELSIMK